MEYFVNNDLLATLEKLSRYDRPHGIKCQSYFILSGMDTDQSQYYCYRLPTTS